MKRRIKTNVLSKMFHIFSGHKRSIILVIIVANIVGSLLETLTVGLMVPFATSLTSIDAFLNSGYGEIFQRCIPGASSNDVVFALSIIMIALYLIKGIYHYVVYWFQDHTFAKLRYSLSVQLFEKVMRKPYSYHLQHNSSETLRMVTTDVDRTFTTLNCIMTLISEGAVGLGILMVLFSTIPKLTITAGLVMAAVLILSNRSVVKKINACAQNNIRCTTELLKWVQQGFGALKSIYANRRQSYFVRQYASNADGVALSNANSSILSKIPKLLVETVTMVGVFGALAIISRMGTDSGRILTIVITFAVAIIRLIPTANRITDVITTATFRMGSISTIYDAVTDRDTGYEPTAREDAQEPLAFHDRIHLEHVTFQHEGAHDPVLRNISLDIHARESVAIVGPTGSGKTTLGDIILGLQKPQIGSVYADGHDIFAEPEWWARQIGYVPQMIYLCDDTICANVAFGYETEDIDVNRVWECLEMAQMKEFIGSLPDGIYTVTGENGVRLSGGQRQRIGIARALYSNPQILIFDEATSALDTETEKAIVSTIDRLANLKTMIIIAHRLSTIQNCSRVYRINASKLIESCVSEITSWEGNEVK